MATGRETAGEVDQREDFGPGAVGFAGGILFLAASWYAERALVRQMQKQMGPRE